jgi:hypothetical protein
MLAFLARRLAASESKDRLLGNPRGTALATSANGGSVAQGARNTQQWKARAGERGLDGCNQSTGYSRNQQEAEHER